MVPLIRQKQAYTFDFEALRKEVTTRSKMLLLCNPHNPTGRSYNINELRQLAQLCIENNMIVCSDEIHCDLVGSNSRVGDSD